MRLMSAFPGRAAPGRCEAVIALAVHVLALGWCPDNKEEEKMSSFDPPPIDEVMMNCQRAKQGIMRLGRKLNSLGGCMVTQIAFHQYALSNYKDTSLAKGIVRMVKMAETLKGKKDNDDVPYSQALSMLEALVDSHSSSLYREVESQLMVNATDAIHVLKKEVMKYLPMFVVSKCMFPELRGGLPWSRAAYSKQELRRLVDEQLSSKFLEVRCRGVVDLENPWLREREDFERWSCDGGQRWSLWLEKGRQ